MPVLQEQKPVIAARRSAGVGASGSATAAGRPPLPRLALVTRPRYRLLGANTPFVEPGQVGPALAHAGRTVELHVVPRAGHALEEVGDVPILLDYIRRQLASRE